MKIVTGAAGFIGSNLVAALENMNQEVVACDRFDDQEKVRNLEKRSLAYRIFPDELFGFLQKHRQKIKTIFLLGAISSTTETNLAMIKAVNVELPIQLWNWCSDNKVRLIYASSAATYGDGSRGFSDDDSLGNLKNLKPLNAYGRSKNEFDIWVSEQIESNAERPPQWVGLKFFNVYGPNEYHKGTQMSVVPQIYNQIIANGRARLFRSHHSDYKDGGQLRDFIWVGDCVSVMLWLDGNPEISGLFNCGTGQARSFLDLAQAVFQAMEKEFAVDYIPTPEKIRDKYQYFTEADIGKLRTVGYRSRFTSLEKGVMFYVKEYLMNDDRYV